MLEKLSDTEKLAIKAKLKAACLMILEERIRSAQKAMDDAQESANSDDKSSAGDKYETTRAMGQLSRDMNAKQLAAAKQEMVQANVLNVSSLHENVTTGSFLVCGEDLFFISLGLGSVIIEEGRVMLLSPTAPLSLALKGKTKGEQVMFNEKNFHIEILF